MAGGSNHCNHPIDSNIIPGGKLIADPLGLGLVG